MTLSRIEQGKRRLTVDDVNWFARSLGMPLTLRWVHEYPSEAREDVDSISRRSLLGAGVGAALGLNATTAPATAREIDPELVTHWMKLLRLLGRHDALCGPHEVLATVRYQLGLIAEHRQIARGEVRGQLLRVEARWSGFASALSDDFGDWHRRDAWADRSVRLAREAGYQDMVAYGLMRQSQWASDSQRAMSFAQAARLTSGTSDKIRGHCALKEARGHALANDTAACERSLVDAYGMLDHVPHVPQTPWDDLGGHDITPPYVLADEARCWLWLRPDRAVTMFDDVLRLWPHDRTRGRGIHQAHLALACAAANEPERAAAEGLKALEIAQTTKSDVTVCELKRLDSRLAACDLPSAADFREALAAL